LFDEGRALLPNVTDELTIGRFRAAEAFMPFWTSVAGRQPTGAEIEAADASARQALEIGARLDVPDLQSAALDALGSNAQQRGHYSEMRSTALRRLDLGERLDLSERIDAACMVAWTATTVGDLAEAAATCESAFRLIQPGQVSNWALHLAAWSALSAELQGNWDQVERSGARAHALWQQLDRVAAGYASRGFLAAFEVARARRDDTGITRWRETLTEIGGAFRDSIRADMEREVIAGDATTAARLLTSNALPAVGYDSGERVLSFILDRGIRLDDSSLEKLGAWIQPAARLIAAQLDRARGLAHSDEAPLRRALAFFEEAGARPAIARVRVELGRLVGDSTLVDAGMRGLLEIGDIDQHDRYSAAHKG
jgi:hypothetical protein